MNRFSRHLTTGTLAIVLSSLASTANGAIFTVSGGSFTNPLGQTEINQSGTLLKFDRSLGTLLSARLKLSGQQIETFNLTNNTAQSVLINGTTTTNLQFTLPNELMLFPNLMISNTSGVQRYRAGETKSFGPYDSMVMSTYIFPGDGALSFFDSAGESFPIHCESLSGFFVQGPGPITATQQAIASCNGEIEYAYEGRNPIPDPEPSAVLGILVLAGIGIFTKRGKS